MKSIEIDIETYSDVDLSRCGVYKYSSSPNFEILLFGYSVDGGDVKVADLACGEEIPAEILAALSDLAVRMEHAKEYDCLEQLFPSRTKMS